MFTSATATHISEKAAFILNSNVTAPTAKRKYHHVQVIVSKKNYFDCLGRALSSRNVDGTKVGTAFKKAGALTVLFNGGEITGNGVYLVNIKFA